MFGRNVINYGDCRTTNNVQLIADSHIVIFQIPGRGLFDVLGFRTSTETTYR